MPFNLKAYRYGKKPVQRTKPKLTEPMLGIVTGYGEVRLEYERGRFHHTIFGPLATAKARAKFRYDPETKTVMWDDREDAKDESIFWSVVNAIESRGGEIERHSTLGGGVMRNTPSFVAKTNLVFQKMAVISPETAKKTKIKTELPTDPKFEEAVRNTEGAFVSEDGLLLPIFRRQDPNQNERRSLRDGVFYQPSGSPRKYPFTGRNGYGGYEHIEGISLFRRPLFIKGAVGGKAPIQAYDLIKGKGSFEKMRNAVLQKIVYGHPLFGTAKTYDDIYRKIESLFEEFGGGDHEVVDEIAGYAPFAKGNGLVYAIQENIIGNAIRKAGYDSVIGWSQRRDGSAFISDVFDVRELTYPAPYQLEGKLHPEFNQEVPLQP